MRTIIAGSRGITDINEVARAVELSGYSGAITEVVCGMARGADRLGKQWAETWHIPVKKFAANWDAFGHASGYIRNVAMAEYVGRQGALIAIYDGESRGTRHMINIARSHHIRTFIHLPNGRTFLEI